MNLQKIVSSQRSHILRIFRLVQVFPRILQYLTSSFQPKYLPSGDLFVSPSTKLNSLTSIYYFPAPGIFPSKDSTFFSDQQNSTPTSIIIGYISILPSVQSTLLPNHIPSSEPIFETSNIPNSPPGILPYDVPPDLPILRL